MLKRIVTAAILTLMPIMANASLIFEQDFENGINGYKAASNISVITNAASGMYITQANRYGNGTQMMGNNGYLDNMNYSYSLVLDLTKYKNITVSFDYAGLVEACCDRFSFTSNAGGALQLGGLNTSSYSFSIDNMPSGYTTFRWGLTSDGSYTKDGYVFDNIKITTTDVSGPLSLAGLGLAFFGLSRRRRKMS